MLRKISYLLGLAFVFGVVCDAAVAKRPLTFEDLVKVARISDPQVSPDGEWVAYVDGRVDLEANKTPGTYG